MLLFCLLLTLLHSLSVTFASNEQQENPKIILVGLPKSGTTSFHQFLERLGMTSAHFRAKKVGIVGEAIMRAKAEGRPLMYYLRNYDAVTEMAFVRFAFRGASSKCYFPQVEDLDRIYEENKDALFILNWRDIDKHAVSMNDFPYYGKILQRTCPDYLPGNSTVSWIDRYTQFITKHNDNVRQFFAAHPEAKFIDFKIEDGDVSVFKPYFDTKNEQFPHAFKSSDRQRIRKL